MGTSKGAMAHTGAASTDAAGEREHKKKREKKREKAKLFV